MRVGLEIELPNVATATQEFLRRVTRCQFSLHDDGSIRGTNLMIDGTAIVPMQIDGNSIVPSGCVSTERFGLELVTRPYEAAEMLVYAGELSEALCKVPDTPRASIHVHIDQGGKSWRKVQRMCKWFYHLEAPLYRLSALNRKHRGTQPFAGREQDYNYCRPLSNSIGVNIGGQRQGPQPLINISELFSANTASTFLAAWGRLDAYWQSLPHWCPHRLHGINIVPMTTQGTVELRIFNGVYRYIQDVLAIVIGLDRLAEGGEPDFEPMLLGSTPDFTAEDMGRLLDWDVRHIWGWHWPRACIMTALPSHYRESNTIPTFSQNELVWITNNRGIGDPGYTLNGPVPSLDLIEAFSLYQ